MDKRKSIKICVGYHKPSFLLSGNCFVPIWGGKSIADATSKDGSGLSQEEIQWMEKYCIGDNAGENISAKNRNYSEASILYWMWKNYEKLENPDYIGFLQYRRHWLLNEKYLELHKPNFYNFVENEYFSDDYQYIIGLTENAIYNEIKDCDGIFCANDTGKTIYEYKKSHHSQDIKYWNKALEIIRQDWPLYAEAAETYNNGTWHAWSNCFIMKREDFLEYCPFLFDVLNKIDAFAAEDYENMTSEQMRVPAYVSETMLGIFWTYKKQQGCKFKSLPLVYIKKPFSSFCNLPKHLPQIKKDAISVVFIADNNYIKYTCVALKSIIENASRENYYDIIILEDGNITKENKKRILEIMPNNFSLRFFNAKHYMLKYNFAEFFHKRLNLMPYLKLFIFEILHKYNKAIFLDGDVIVLKDIANLYRLPLKEKLIAASQDFMVTNVKIPFWNFRRKYISSNKKMKNVNNYFNSGVIIFNLQAMRQEPELINEFLNEARFKHKDRLHHDQDVLNFVLEDKTYFLPQEYNLQYNLLNPIHYNFTPAHIQNKFKNILESNKINILHFDGDLKPWKSDIRDYLTDKWWFYARMTPFYEEFLKNTFEQINVGNIKLKNELIELVRDTSLSSKSKFRYWRYKLLSKITFGKRRKKYKQKKKELKQKLKQIRQILRGSK